MEIVTRDRWGSKSKWKYGDMKLPATGAFLHHSVTPVTDFPYQDARRVEAEGIARFGQMSYSYLVHPAGVILEGAGTKTGAHTAGRNSTSFGICLIGDYDDAPGDDVWRTPNQLQIDAVRWLVHYLKVTKNWLNDAAVLQPHKAVVQTACPGNKTMPLLEQFRNPWVPPVIQPPPVLVPGPIMELDMRVRFLTLQIPLDENGRGWLKLPYPIDKILSATPHSGTRPGADGVYDGTPDAVGLTPEDSGTIIVLQGATPRSTAPVWLQIIED